MKSLRSMPLFSRKVAIKVAFMHKHFKWPWFTQAIYLHIMLNISRLYLARNGNLLSTVCVACWNFAPCCMKLLGNLPIWPTVLDWCLVGTFLQLLLVHYSVKIGYQREHNYTEIVLKHVFLNNTFTFCAIGLLDESFSKKLHVKKKVAI